MGRTHKRCRLHLSDDSRIRQLGPDCGQHVSWLAGHELLVTGQALQALGNSEILSEHIFIP